MSKVIIERKAKKVTIQIHTARPGIVHTADAAQQIGLEQLEIGDLVARPVRPHRGGAVRDRQVEGLL